MRSCPRHNMKSEFVSFLFSTIFFATHPSGVEKWSPKNVSRALFFSLFPIPCREAFQRLCHRHLLDGLARTSSSADEKKKHLKNCCNTPARVMRYLENFLKYSKKERKIWKMSSYKFITKVRATLVFLRRWWALSSLGPQWVKTNKRIEMN